MLSNPLGMNEVLGQGWWMHATVLGVLLVFLVTLLVLNRDLRTRNKTLQAINKTRGDIMKRLGEDVEAVTEANLKYQKEITKLQEANGWLGIRNGELENANMEHELDNSSVNEQLQELNQRYHKLDETNRRVHSINEAYRRVMGERIKEIDELLSGRSPITKKSLRPVRHRLANGIAEENNE